MADTQRPQGNVESQPASTVGHGAFNEWLQVQLRARRLTQRQLAQLSGVDHSTISRLMSGDRVPSLRTATRLALGLGMPEDLGRLDSHGPGPGRSPMARVEYALRADDVLREAEVREIMHVYLALRLGRLRRAAPSAKPGPTKRTPRTVVSTVVVMRPR
jgi:transcriptional regulator with XRE-family HTH domain